MEKVKIGKGRIIMANEINEIKIIKTKPTEKTPDGEIKVMFEMKVGEPKWSDAFESEAKAEIFIDNL